MPTQIVIDITDPVNLDAWGLHPIPGLNWVLGSYVKGTVTAYKNVLWLANTQTSGTPGVSSDWVAMIANPGGIGVLDSNNFLKLSNAPITRGQGRRALKANGGTGGAVWPASGNWLKIVENALGADEGDDNVIAFDDAFWPIGGNLWSLIQTALAAGLGAFSSAQLQSLQGYAITNR